MAGELAQRNLGRTLGGGIRVRQRWLTPVNLPFSKRRPRKIKPARKRKSTKLYGFG